jgi:hypothetical protein
VAGLSYTHARTDNLTRFFNANDRCSAMTLWGPGLPLTRPGRPGLGSLTVVQSTAPVSLQRHYGGAPRAPEPPLEFQLNYTLSWDKADDDNERDPFTFRYARPTRWRRNTTGATATSATASMPGCWQFFRAMSS